MKILGRPAWLIGGSLSALGVTSAIVIYALCTFSPTPSVWFIRQALLLPLLPASSLMLGAERLVPRMIYASIALIVVYFMIGALLGEIYAEIRPEKRWTVYALVGVIAAALVTAGMSIR